MGQPKLTLSLAGKTVLEHVVEALRQAGVERILVITAPHVAEVAALARQAKVDVLELPASTPDMRATVQAGLEWLQTHFRPDPEDAWLLVPADHPALEPAVVRQILQTRERLPDCSLIVPTFEGRRGHPTLLGWSHVAELRTLPENVGLNAYLRQRHADTLELPVDSPSVTWDLDTPEDLLRIRGWFGE
jgi:molybdenum cofactor cytidylyltransferase